jgi:radical SAM protein with 4Fe4S-binding SPASM domain
MAVIEKIIKDCEGKNIESIWIGDNGESLMHPQFKEIVTKLKIGFPKTAIGLVSNFYLMDADMAKFVVDNFNYANLNIDGWSEEAYYAVKHMSLYKILDNLKVFLSTRLQKHNRIVDLSRFCQIHISILTQARYYSAIGEPEKITVKDETLKVWSEVREMLEVVDTTLCPFPLTWAERAKWNKPREKKNCIGMPVMHRKLFIDSNGGVYCCCLDYDSEILFGNILDNTIEEIWNGEKRKRFMDLCFSGHLKEVGLPCSICQD